MTIDDPVDPKELTQEKSVWQLYVSSRRIKSTPIDAGTAAVTCILASAYSACADTHALTDQIRALANDGLNYSAAILGFLIAGFAVLASLGTSRLVLAMAQTRDKDSLFPFIKHHYLNIIKVFIFYWVLVIVCTILKIVGAPSGIATVLVRDHGFWVSTIAAFAVAQLTFIGLTTVFIYAVMLLKSLIYNVYMTIMAMIRFEMSHSEPKVETGK